jgi:hypothetical protein
MTVVYEDAKTPDAIRGRKFMEDENLLNQFADDINAPLKLPFDIDRFSRQGNSGRAWTMKLRMCGIAVLDNVEAVALCSVHS